MTVFSKLSKRCKCSECQLKLMATESWLEHDDYLQQLSRAGIPSIALRDFIFQTLSIINLFHQQQRPLLKMYMSEEFQRGHY